MQPRVLLVATASLRVPHHRRQSKHHVHHRRTKHVEIFVREKVALGELRVIHVPTSLQFADIITKGLPRQVFEDFRSSLNVLWLRCGQVLYLYKYVLEQ
jgi:hypothetical protein